MMKSLTIFRNLPMLLSIILIIISLSTNSSARRQFEFRREFNASHHRLKRFTTSRLDFLLPARTTALICEMCILLDAEFEKAFGPHVNSTLTTMIDRVSWVFRAVDWNQDGVPDNIGFRIHSIERNWNLLPSESSKSYKKRKDGRYLLSLFGKSDYAHCCIAIGFTMRPFLRNEVAVSIRGERRDVGGICEYRRSDPDDVDEAVATSLNLILISGTGPSGLVLKTAQLEMTLLHEVGHSFGSKHDFDLSHSTEEELLRDLRECSGHDPNLLPPRDRRIHGYKLFEPLHGRFIMWPSTAEAKESYRRNNYVFSPCSKRRIRDVLQDFGHKFCFKEDTNPFCGNAIAEDSEECDCGLEVDCSLTGCCGHRYSQRPCQILNASALCPQNFQRMRRNSTDSFEAAMEDASTQEIQPAHFENGCSRQILLSKATLLIYYLLKKLFSKFILIRNRFSK